MDKPIRAGPPQALLFACAQNAVRSPMAAAIFRQLFGRVSYARSAGAKKGEIDPFAIAVMDEIGIDLSKHRPRTFEELEDLDGLNFDLIITLSPEAHHRALELTRRLAVDVEYWPTADPTIVEGSREQRLEGYRSLRDQLMARIKQRFTWRPRGNE
jgi:protein-tyrosine-phosphatase